MGSSISSALLQRQSLNTHTHFFSPMRKWKCFKGQIQLYYNYGLIFVFLAISYIIHYNLVLSKVLWKVTGQETKTFILQYSVILPHLQCPLWFVLHVMPYLCQISIWSIYLCPNTHFCLRKIYANTTVKHRPPLSANVISLTVTKPKIERYQWLTNKSVHPNCNSNPCKHSTRG